MMDKLQLVPHVRSERKRITEGTCSRQGPGEEGARKEEADRKRGRRKREESGAREGGRQEECRRVFRSIPPFYGVPLHSCRYAAHPRISSPLGSHVIERSPSRGETQPIHILCSPPCIPWREEEPSRERERRVRKRKEQERERDRDRKERERETARRVEPQRTVFVKRERTGWERVVGGRGTSRRRKKQKARGWRRESENRGKWKIQQPRCWMEWALGKPPNIPGLRFCPLAPVRDLF